MKINSNNIESTVQPLALGKRVKELRLSQNLTLEQASQLTGLARSTLSKIENEQISPTFAAVSKLAAGLGIALPQLFSQPKPDVAQKTNSAGRRDITRAGEGKLHPTPTYEHELLATQLSNKKMVPFKTNVRARAWEDYSDWVRHEGEEFLFVISGSIILYTEFYEPIELHQGDSAYYDCEMGHALISISEQDAEVLWVTA
ncbi:MAG TPA: XRE family transcriptional regulator [Marinobacterium sp.]|nr:XRE family transcriptional regulator [Marinobacterium sp.]